MAGNEKNKKWFVVMAAVIVCFAFAGAARAGTGWQERQKLLAAGGAGQGGAGKVSPISGVFSSFSHVSFRSIRTMIVVDGQVRLPQYWPAWNEVSEPEKAAGRAFRLARQCNSSERSSLC